MKKSKMPVQGKGVIRDVNRSQIEGGVEASGIGSTLLKTGLSFIPGVGGILSSLV